MLAAHFWSELGGPGRIPSTILARWADDPWPGNVRELRNAVARQLALGDVLTDASEEGSPEPRGRADYLDEIVAKRLPLPIARLRAVSELERRYLASVLAEHDGNIARAADASGIGRRYFQMIHARVKKG
jgi:DNA-binding NtrC family response regulator